MVSTHGLRLEFEALQAEAERLAGGIDDLAQRAAVYHHLYEHSGRNHIFPLIAAHGAMWAGGYFGFGMKLGWCCSWQYAFSPKLRRERFAQLVAFADAFRDINRRVCIETYTSYHFTQRYGDHAAAANFVPAALLQSLNRCHRARRDGRELDDAAKREVFETFFRKEQETIVEQSIASAVKAFDWPLMKMLAVRPLIRFAYFSRLQPFFFRNFANKHERIEKGLRAFDLAAAIGWDAVEAALKNYAVLPPAFFNNSVQHFAEIRKAALAAA